jgi:hypothetical protein
MANAELDRAAMTLEARAHWQAKRRETPLGTRVWLGLAAIACGAWRVS